MSEPIRLTFVSDTTDEFPENTNASFKVRLPERMTLKGEGWYVSLWKMTVPDHSQSSSVISSDMDLKVVKSTLKMLQFTNKNSKEKFQSVNLKTMTKSSTLKYIMSDDKPVSSGKNGFPLSSLMQTDLCWKKCPLKPLRITVPF